MKFVLPIIFIPLILLGCTKPNESTPGYTSISSKALQSTQGLEDCVLYEFKPDLNDSNTIKIVRCSNEASVSTSQTKVEGKHIYTESTIIVNGDKYKKVVE